MLKLTEEVRGILSSDLFPTSVSPRTVAVVYGGGSQGEG